MILDSLDLMKIPYLVIKYRISSGMLPKEYGQDRFQIITDYNPRLTRLGFKPEKEIFRFRDKIMYRKLRDRELAVFKTRSYPPVLNNEHGSVWEFNGKVRRYLNPIIERNNQSQQKAEYIQMKLDFTDF